MQFVLRTADADWVTRHNGITDNDGRTTVDVDDTEEITFAGRTWLRHFFADPPEDFGSGWVMCPVAWPAG